MNAPTRAFGRSRIAYLCGQLPIAAAELRAFATFTPFGHELFEELAAAVADKVALAVRLGIGEEEPVLSPNGDGTFSRESGDDGCGLTIGAALRRHMEQFDIFGRCRALNLAPYAAA